jgi:hypothetical protein
MIKSAEVVEMQHNISFSSTLRNWGQCVGLLGFWQSSGVEGSKVFHTLLLYPKRVYENIKITSRWGYDQRQRISDFNVLNKKTILIFRRET